jgi:hypothetical protein
MHMCIVFENKHSERERESARKDNDFLLVLGITHKLSIYN